MDKENAPGIQNERLLWHGTSPEAVDSIATYGFNRSYCGKNGKTIFQYSGFCQGETTSVGFVKIIRTYTFDFHYE